MDFNTLSTFQLEGTLFLKNNANSLTLKRVNHKIKFKIIELISLNLA